MVKASSHTYTTCFGSPGTGMPHLTEVREMDRSRRPLFTNSVTSFLRDSGRMNPGCAYSARSLSAYFDRRKK